MPTQLPPTTAQDLDRGRIPSPCHNTHLELTSPPNKYECRECAAEYVIPDGADAPAEAEASESEGDEGDSSDSHEKPESRASDAAALIDAGECPWCDEYSGSHVGQHASSAHADEWAAYKSE